MGRMQLLRKCNERRMIENANDCSNVCLSALLKGRGGRDDRDEDENGRFA